MANNKVGKDLLQRLITALIEENDYTDELKLELFEALGGGTLDSNEDSGY